VGKNNNLMIRKTIFPEFLALDKSEKSSEGKPPELSGKMCD